MINIRYLGQNGFRFDMNGKIIYIDLYLSNCVFELTGSGVRNYEPPVKAEEITDADIYLISHEHLDHLDPETVKSVAKASANVRFICPYPHMNILLGLGIPENRITGAKTDESICMDGIEIMPVAVRHEDYNIINGHHGNLGYLIRSGDTKLFHAGDAVSDIALAERLKKEGGIDIMFLPINGHDWKRFSADIMGNMNYREALDLCAYAGADTAVPMHYDLFDNNTENPAFFVDYLYKAYPTQKFKMFIPGETLYYKP